MMPQDLAPRKALWLAVVTAILRRGDQVLVGLRPEGHSLAGQWEFPGGKVERHERPEEALKRELKEELGIDSEIGRIRLAATHTYRDIGIVMMFYDVPFWKGEPKSVHHSEIRWIRPDELKTLKIPEANQNILPQILQILNEGPHENRPHY